MSRREISHVVFPRGSAGPDARSARPARSRRRSSSSALRPDAPFVLGDELLDGAHERVDELSFLVLADDLAAADQQPAVLAAGDADVGLAGFARAVHRAAENRNRDRLLDVRQPAPWLRRPA